MARRAQLRRIKAHRTYTIQEAAICTGVTEQTIRRWVSDGLRIMAEQRPFLILGSDLSEHLKERRGSAHAPMPVGDFYCLSCKAKLPPALGLMEYRPLSDRHGMLHAFCGGCEGPVSRIVRWVDLPRWGETCGAQISIAQSA
ncbi:MAG: helix-turn-helix domain-containing protein [Pseudomonadota bacterium]